MKGLDYYITEQQIILKLCKIRARYAELRSKKQYLHGLTENEAYNFHINKKENAQKLDEEEKKLMSLLPSRRKWKKLNKKNRRTSKNQRINSFSYNIKSLYITIEYYKKHHPKEPFLIKLRSFVREIQLAINDPYYKIKKPQILPDFKELNNKGEVIYRPIASYSLKDRIIVGLINNYFTQVFDPFFYSNSYAFRAPQVSNNIQRQLTHHDAVEAILGYLSKLQGKCLWVAECDIKKFFDTIDHTIIISHFSHFWDRLCTNYPEISDERAKHIFFKYLDAFSFKRDVLSKNLDKNYWKHHTVKPGKFEWADGVTTKENFDEMVGVPQGGALSGLIANIVLHFTDKKINALSKEDLLYVRFCDDMMLIHPSKEICKKSFDVYYNELKQLNLIPHQPEQFVNDSKSSRLMFWKSKSKYPYKWSLDELGAFHWIGFVGYEIHYSGALRIRKKSLIKEKNKQTLIVNQVTNAIKTGQRKELKTIARSTTKKLISMSVGHINMNNYKTIENQMCWMNGFKLLKDNEFLRPQLKQLDRNRTNSIRLIYKRANKKRKTGINIKTKQPKKYSYDPKFYGRPFSYYFQIIEKGK